MMRFHLTPSCRPANLFLIIAALLPACLLVGLSTVRPARADARIQWETAHERWSWTADARADVSLSETTSQMGIGFDITRNLSMQLKAGFADATLTRSPAHAPEQEHSVSGLLDARLRLAYRAGDRWLLRAGINGPTGMTEFTPEEFTLAQALSARVLAFEGHRLGQGFDLDAGVSYAFPWGPAVCGVGAGYLAKGEYTITEDGSDYAPGDQITLAAGVDLSRPRWLWRSNLRAVLYGSDQYDRRDLYETADRYELQSMLLYRWLGTSLWGSVTFMTYGTAKTAAGEGLVEESERTHGDELYLDAGLKRTISPAATLRFTAGTRVFTGNEIGTGKASRIDLGAGCRWRLGRTVAADLQGRYGFGTLKELIPELGNQIDSDLTGFRTKAALIIDL